MRPRPGHARGVVLPSLPAAEPDRAGPALQRGLSDSLLGAGDRTAGHYRLWSGSANHPAPATSPRRGEGSDLTRPSGPRYPRPGSLQSLPGSARLDLRGAAWGTCWFRGRGSLQICPRRRDRVGEALRVPDETACLRSSVCLHPRHSTLIRRSGQPATGHFLTDQIQSLQGPGHPLGVPQGRE